MIAQACGIQVKGLCAQIKEAKSGLVWSVKGGRHTVSDGRWAIRLDELPPEAGKLLNALFGGEPPEGTHLSLLRGKVRTGCGTPGLDPFFEGMDGKEAVRTPLIREVDGELYRVYRSGEDFIYVAERYLRGIDAASYRAKVTAQKEFRRVCFPEANYLVLCQAGRPEDIKEHGFLKELLEQAEERDRMNKAKGGMN